MEIVRERVRRGGGGGGRGGRRGRGRQEGAQRGPNLTNEIRATLVDHVVNHGLTLREAGLRVQPNLSRYTVASVMRTFRLENRYCKNIIISKTSARFQSLLTVLYYMLSALLLPFPVKLLYYCILGFFLHRIEGQGRQGGRPPMFTEQQEREIVNMVLANNAITLKQLQANIVNNHGIFNDIHQVSTSTLARILKNKHSNEANLSSAFRAQFRKGKTTAA